MMFSGGSLVEKLGSNSEKALESLRSIPPVDKCSQWCTRDIRLADMSRITSGLEALETSERLVGELPRSCSVPLPMYICTRMQV
jgi:hypothetical protein